MKAFRATITCPARPTFGTISCDVAGRTRADAILSAQVWAGHEWALTRSEAALLKVKLEDFDTVDERSRKADRVCRGLAQLVVEYGNEGRVSLVDKVRGVLNEVAADRALAARLYDALTSEGAK